MKSRKSLLSNTNVQDGFWMLLLIGREFLTSVEMKVVVLDQRFHIQFNYGALEAANILYKMFNVDN